MDMVGALPSVERERGQGLPLKKGLLPPELVPLLRLLNDLRWLVAMTGAKGGEGE